MKNYTDFVTLVRLDMKLATSSQRQFSPLEYTCNYKYRPITTMTAKQIEQMWIDTRKEIEAKQSTQETLL